MHGTKSELPTIEQAQEFLRVVNKGRKAIGLDALDKLDFDGAEPNSIVNCLSARNLYSHAGLVVYGNFVVTKDSDVQLKDQDTLAEVIGATCTNSACSIKGTNHYTIPKSITIVTDYFDSIRPEFTDKVNTELRQALRERLVEAGVV